MKIQHIIVIAAILIGGFMAVKDAMRPRPPTIEFIVSGENALVIGTTDSYSYNVISDFRRDNPEVKRLILQAMPGTQDVVTNTRLVREIREAGLATHVPANGRIASGAVDWFIAGNPRTIECGAMIGVHSWGSPLGSRGDKTFFDPQRIPQRDFLKDMGVDPDFYEFTRAAAGPDEIHWLSMDEMLRFGLIKHKPDC